MLINTVSLSKEWKRSSCCLNVIQQGVLKIHNHWLQVMALNCMSESTSNILSPICCFKGWNVCSSVSGCTVSPQCCLQVTEAQNNKYRQWLTEVNWVIVRMPVSRCRQWCFAACSAPLLTVWSLSHRERRADGEEATLLQSNECDGFKLKN